MSALATDRRVRWALIALLLLTWGEFAARALWPALLQVHWPNPGYWVAARLTLEGQVGALYDRAAFFAACARLGTYPDVYDANMPLTLLPLLPLGLLSERAAHIVWTLVMLGCFLGALGWLARALGLSAPAALALGALAPLFHPWRENVARGQMYALVLLLAVGSAALMMRGARPAGAGRSLAAGALLGGLGLAKLYYATVLLLPSLARRRARVLAAAGAALGLTVAVTLILWGAAPWESAIRAALGWRERPETAVTAYQTLNGLLSHLLRDDAQWNPGPALRAPGLVAPLWWALAGGLVVASGLTALRGATARAPGTPAEALLLPALAATLAPLIAPIAEDYHYTLALFPLVVAAVAIGGRRGRRETRVALAALLVATVLLAAPWRFNVPSVGGWHALLYYPRVYGALLLWALLSLLLWRAPGRAVGESAPAGGP
jgi:hypothetical protein